MDHPLPDISDKDAVRASIAASEADLAAARIVSAGPVLDRMRESLRRMEARLDAKLGTVADV